MVASHPERERAAERRLQAFQLRKAGNTYEAIGEALGVSKVAAYKLVRRVVESLDSQSQAEAKVYRALQLARLEEALKAIWPRAMAGELKAVDRVIKILEREAKLLCLDQPIKIDVTDRVRQMAIEYGLDPDEAVETARRIIRDYGSGSDL